MEPTKIDENTLQVITQPPTPEPITVSYDYGFLKKQLIDIQKQKDDFDALRDAEILEVQNLIAQADKLGIVAKVEPIIEPIVKPTPIEPAPIINEKIVV